MEVKAIDKRTVHQICSGQVVLSLAIAVKELVENSIDAGATTIEVKLKEHGLDLLEVSDNGSGIAPGNFAALTLKHHTSKLSEFEDLMSVSTFGFRGEALSSLCALSNLEVTTCHRTQSVATRIEYDSNGVIKSQTNCAREVGTTVSLRNLFHSLPVRYKEFQRNIKKEFSRMVHMLHGYCIISTGVRISCYNQTGKGKRQLVLATSGASSLKDNIVSVFGHKQSHSVVELVECKREEVEEGEDSDTSILDSINLFKLRGYVSRCTHGSGRSTTDRQFYYCNSRPFELAKLTKVVNEVYHTYNRNQSPFVVMDIVTNRDTVDVNITPDKRKLILVHEKALLFLVKVSGLVSFPFSIPPYYKASLHKIYKSSLGEYQAVGSVGRLPVHRGGGGGGEGGGGGLNPLSGTQAVSEVISPSTSSFNLSLSISSPNLSLSTSPSNLSLSTSPSTPPSPSLWKLKRSSPSTTPSSPSLWKLKRRSVSGFDQSESHERGGGRGGGGGRASGPPAPKQPKLFDCGVQMEPAANGHTVVQEEDPTTQNNDSNHFMSTSHCAPSPLPAAGDGVMSPLLLNNNNYYYPLMANEEEEEGPLGTAGLNKLHKTTGSCARCSDGNHGDGECNLSTTTTTTRGIVQPVKVVSGDHVREHTVSCDMTAISQRLRARPTLLRQDEEAKEEEEEEVAGNAAGLQRGEEVEEEEEEEEEEDKRKEERDGKGGKKKMMRFRAKIKPGDNQSAEQELRRQIHKEDFERMSIVGQFNRGFIIARLENNIFIIDQHATDEAFNYDRLQKEAIIDHQSLIQPRLLELTAVGENTIMDNLEIFRKNGFVFVTDTDAPPTKRIRLKSQPVYAGVKLGIEEIEEMIFLLSDNTGEMIRPMKLSKLFASKACRSSIMIGRALSKAEMKKLLNQIKVVDNPWNCPHGRPVIRHLLDLSVL